MNGQPPRVRIRTAKERKKALAQLTELRATGQVAKALVIVEMRNGDFQVLGQEMLPWELPRALYAATMAIQHAETQRLSQQPEPLEIPLAWGPESNPGDRIRPKITRDAQGVMVPPPGETVISCPVCHHPRYYVCVGEPGTSTADLVARIACAHCGNEASWSRDDYREGEG